MKRKFLIVTYLILYCSILFGQLPDLQTYDNLLNKELFYLTQYPSFLEFDSFHFLYLNSSNTKSISYFNGVLEGNMDIDSSIINGIKKRGYSKYNSLNSYPIELLYFFHDSIVSLKCFQYFLPLTDTIIVEMNNLRFLRIYGRNNIKFLISNWNIPLISLNLDHCELPTNIDITQFELSLKSLAILAEKIKKNTILDYSRLHNLEYLKFQDYSKTSQYSIVFPPNVKCIHFLINKNQLLKFPTSTEVLFLEIKNKTKNIPILSHLINLKFLSILPENTYDKNNYVPLPKEISQIKSLQSLQILYVNDENIEVISQIPHLKTLQLVEQKMIPQNLFKLVNIENIEFSYYTPDSIIQSFRKVLPNVKITRCNNSTPKSFFRHLF
jgi:hypothetical protein